MRLRRANPGTVALPAKIAIALLLLAAVTPNGSRASAEANSREHLNLILIVDGLRPDYVTPEIMPNLHALGERGVFGKAHSAAFPSVTRVNSATISTGSYPARHGVLHNKILVRDLSDEAFSTRLARKLRRLEAHSRNPLLDAPTLGTFLNEGGLELFVTGSGGSLKTFLSQNPVAGSGMSVWTTGGLFVPRHDRANAVRAIGKLPKADSQRTVWAFEACRYRLTGDNPPDVIAIWVHEVDGAGHRHGVGAVETLHAAGNVDVQIGRLIDALEQTLPGKVNIFVTSDHGFSTKAGGFHVSRALRKGGVGMDGVKVVREMVFLEREDPGLLKDVVEALQRDRHVGNVYTRARTPGSAQGVVPGTLSTAVIQWNHESAADVFVTPAWSDELNEHGFAGSSSRGGSSPASHGSDSPYDLRIPLVAAGPDIKRGVQSDVPTGNVDLAPTVLYLLGMEPPPGMDGRVLHELLRDGPSPDEVAVREHTYSAEVVLDDGLRYEARLDTAEVGSTVYLRGARTDRHSSRSP